MDTPRLAGTPIARWFHGKSVYKWMIKGTPILGNLHSCSCNSSLIGPNKHSILAVHAFIDCLYVVSCGFVKQNLFKQSRRVFSLRNNVNHISWKTHENPPFRDQFPIRTSIHDHLWGISMDFPFWLPGIPQSFCRRPISKRKFIEIEEPGSIRWGALENLKIGDPQNIPTPL